MDHQKLDCQLFRSPRSCVGAECKNPKALSCLPGGRQSAGAWKPMCHAQWDRELSISQTEPEAPADPLAEVAATVSAVVGLETETKGPWVTIGRKQSTLCPVHRKSLVPSVISKCTWAGFQDGSLLPATSVPIPGPGAARRTTGRPTSRCTLGAPAGPKPAKPLPPTLTLWNQLPRPLPHQQPPSRAAVGGCWSCRRRECGAPATEK